jgi:hypothetical protein
MGGAADGLLVEIVRFYGANPFPPNLTGAYIIKTMSGRAFSLTRHWAPNGGLSMVERCRTSVAIADRRQLRALDEAPGPQRARVVQRFRIPNGVRPPALGTI